MRGEHFHPYSHFTAQPGSSPHAWGTPTVARFDCSTYRFIPTCVGNTSLPPLLDPFEAVHPHMRGEHETNTIEALAKARFIPTCVGNTTGRRLSTQSAAVHPHMRGEHTARSIDRLPKIRFIPTCVGNTVGRERFNVPTAVHPHMRGEHKETNKMDAQNIGSSPHAWGTQLIAHH